MIKLAIYGKGGIGKSTIAANLAAAMAVSGQRVLQIGCDPKHDSTRLLLDGRTVMTALDYMRQKAPAEQCLDDLLHTGYGGVVCAEAGGPEPGVGCAGRGILSTFALFERLGLSTEDFDAVIYDVLGDVVCGGFAVPLRKGFADVVLIVTSEEFMAIYAANNILKGLHNFDGAGPRLAGILLNSRGETEDPLPVERFAQATATPIVGRIPRSERFRLAEKTHRTVVEAFADTLETNLFRDLAHQLTRGMNLVAAKPLDDDALERIVLAGEDTPGGIPAVIPPALPATEKKPSRLTSTTQGNATRLLSKSMLFREPLHGCAFTGAISLTVQVRGAVTVAHAPRSCSHIAGRTVLSSGLRSLCNTGIVLPRQLSPALVSTDMNEETAVYGGGDRLRETLREVLAGRPEAVFVIDACPPGVIGDDPEAVIREVAGEYPSIPILPITADGNIRGDFMQGLLNACTEGAAALIDPAVVPEGSRVNILAEKNIANNTESNFNAMTGLLASLGITVNCRFVRDVGVDDLTNFCKARLNLLAYDDHFGRVLRDFLTDRFGVPFCAYPFPVGFFETARWLDAIATHFGKTAISETIIAEYRQRYRQQMDSLRPHLSGRRLMIISYIHDVDWVLETAFDAGMIVEKVGILDYTQDNVFRTRFDGRFTVETGYTAQKRDADLRRLRPDLLLCNYVPNQLPIALHADGIPLCPDVGFEGGVILAKRWATLLKAPVREGWRDDAPQTN